MSELETTERRPTGLRDTRSLLDGLFEPRGAIYWPDMLLSAGLGWAGFVLAVTVDPFSPSFFVGLALGVFALYRAVLFIHELTHLRRGAVPGLATAWNLLVGVPLLVPSFTYVGVHVDHHRRTLYGTPMDPEYLPLARGPRSQIVGFLAETALIPLLLFIRFVILVPPALLFPPLHRWLERHASSLVINLAYTRRDLSQRERGEMMMLEGLTCAWGASACALVYLGHLPPQAFLVWYLTSFGIALVNQVRTLGAHRYQGDGRETDVVGQLLDSVTVSGGWWTELWAPVGLRYHALHHFLPDLPYHSLGTAHRVLLRELPADAPYRAAVHPGLAGVLRELWVRAGTREASSPSLSSRRD
jgi:fatty acid desaturase